MHEKTIKLILDENKIIAHKKIYLIKIALSN